jgi:hypothetical protein
MNSNPNRICSKQKHIHIGNHARNNNLASKHFNFHFKFTILILESKLIMTKIMNFKWKLKWLDARFMTPLERVVATLCSHRWGYDIMTTPLGILGLGFVLFVYIVWRLMFVYFWIMNGLRALSCINNFFVRAHAVKL